MLGYVRSKVVKNVVEEKKEKCDGKWKTVEFPFEEVANLEKVLKNMEAKMSYVIENLTVRLGPTLTLTLPHRLTSALQKTYRPNEMTRPREGPIRELGGKCTPRSPRSLGGYTSIPPVGGHTFCPRASRCLIDFPAKNVTVEFYNACCAGVLPDGRRPLRV